MRSVAASFAADECPFLAGGVAYQLFFSLIPLLALVVGVLSFLYGPERAQIELAQLFRTVYPSADAQEVRIARELVEGRAVSLGIGLVGTILGASAVHGSIDLALAVVLAGGRKRSFVRGHVEGLAFVAGLALVAVASIALSYVTVVAVLSPLLGLAAGWFFFYAIYRYVPRTPTSVRVVRMAALVSAVLWEIAKVAFGFFARGLGIFSAYGPIAFAAGLLIWVYLTAVIILIGAEFMKVRTRPY